MGNYLKKIGILLGVCLLLTACSTNAEPSSDSISETITTTKQDTEPITPADGITSTSKNAGTTTVTSGTFVYYSHDLIEENNLSYICGDQNKIIAISCPDEQIVIPSATPMPSENNLEALDDRKTFYAVYFKESDFAETYFQHDVAAYLPYCQDLTVEEGIEEIWWDEDCMYAPQLESLTFPSTLTRIHTVYQNELADLIEKHLEATAIPYMPDAEAYWVSPDTSEVIAMPTMILSERFSEEEFLTLQRNATGALFFRLDQLNYIDVDDGNPAFYDIDGVLYGNASADYLSLDFLLWHPSKIGIPQKRLLCVPQNYACENGVYVIPEGTDYIHTGAIYRCGNLDAVIVPNTVTYFAPASIVGTADHPLTVVCSPNSAAAQYVEQFGEMYHLALQFMSQTESRTPLQEQGRNIYMWVNALTVRWGEVIEESRYDSYLGTIKDENGEDLILMTGMTCVEIEVVTLWNQADEITSGNVPRSLSEITYLWVDDMSLSMIQKGDTAIVFPFRHDPIVTDGYDFSPYYQYLCRDGFQDYSVLCQEQEGLFFRANVYPITEGKIQIEKAITQHWSAQTKLFFRYNELLDLSNLSTPRFADGMTVDEFAQLMEQIKSS